MQMGAVRRRVRYRKRSGWREALPPLNLEPPRFPNWGPVVGATLPHSPLLQVRLALSVANPSCFGDVEYT